MIHTTATFDSSQRIDSAQLDMITGGFSWKKVGVAAGVGFVGAGAGGLVGCWTTGPAYPVCVATSAVGGAISAGVWNTASQHGLL